MQRTIPGILPEDQAKLNQVNLLFGVGPSANQETLEILKREYSQTGLSEREKKELAKAIQEEKDRPIVVS